MKITTEVELFGSQVNKCNNVATLEAMLGRQEMIVGLCRDAERKSVVHQKKNLIKKRIADLMLNSK